MLRSRSFNPASPGPIGGTTPGPITGTVITATGRFVAPNGSSVAPTYQIGGPGFGFYETGTGIAYALNQSPSLVFRSSPAEWKIKSDTSFAWVNTTNAETGTSDTNLSRLSPGLIGVGSGLLGSFAGSLKLTDVFTNNAAAFLRTNTTLTNSAAAQVATMTNGPTAGNPTKWIGIDDNGTTRQIPAW